MTYLIIGLVVFLGLHSIRIVAEDWRSAKREAWGEQRWKGAYTVISLLSFALIVWGYGQARQAPVVLWEVAAWGRGAAALLMLLSMLLLGGFHLAKSHISVAVRHPMVWSVVVLAVAHLLANNTLADLLLFGSFGVWALADVLSCYQRDRRYQVVYPTANWRFTLVNIGVGVLMWLVIARWLHLWLIGVSPMPSAAG